MDKAWHRDLSGQISVLFPRNIFIKCFLWGRGADGRVGDHFQSEKIFNRNLLWEISLLFPGNIFKKCFLLMDGWGIFPVGKSINFLIEIIREEGNFFMIISLCLTGYYRLMYIIVK